MLLLGSLASVGSELSFMSTGVGGNLAGDVEKDEVEIEDENDIFSIASLRRD